MLLVETVFISKINDPVLYSMWSRQENEFYYGKHQCQMVIGTEIYYEVCTICGRTETNPDEVGL